MNPFDFTQIKGGVLTAGRVLILSMLAIVLFLASHIVLKPSRSYSWVQSLITLADGMWSQNKQTKKLAIKQTKQSKSLDSENRMVLERKGD